MTELILKNDLEKSKMDALLLFLKSWNIEAEVKRTKEKTAAKKQAFSLASGMWKDYNIEAAQLRKQAWNRNK